MSCDSIIVIVSIKRKKLHVKRQYVSIYIYIYERKEDIRERTNRKMGGRL